MHQSSHRILRWTDDDRPFTKDFQDLFCTLMVAVPLQTHRVRLTKRPSSFTTGDAIAHLGNLRFIQSNRRPSPNDPNVTVTTKIATTFSMVPHMARYLCKKFLTARFIESVEARTEFQDAGSVWQLTPKGISLLNSFAHRNGVQSAHIFTVLESPRNTMHILVLERESDTDTLNTDRSTVEVIFRRFAGPDGPNTPSPPSASGSDSDSISDAPNGIKGVKLSKEQKVGSVVHSDTFTGKAALEWLMNCCTLVDEREALQIGRLFIAHKFIVPISEEGQAPRDPKDFSSHKSSIYKVTSEGKRVARWELQRKEAVKSAKSGNAARDSTNGRMMWILETPSLRLLFREYLRNTHCEENLIFYLEVKDFLGRWNTAVEKQAGKPVPMETIRECLAGAYDLYNAFLAPGSPCELNIDHALRNALVGRMTRFELPDPELLATVGDVVKLYDSAQKSVFKLMASDSVPKFMRDPQFSHAIAEHHYEGVVLPSTIIRGPRVLASAA